MTDRETNEPNEEGFAGEPTTPEPETERPSEGLGESVAVPSGDLTGSITGAIEGLTDDDES